MMWATFLTLALSALVNLRQGITGTRSRDLSKDAMHVDGCVSAAWFTALAYAIWERIP
jgi:hypothetical protein